MSDTRRQIACNPCGRIIVVPHYEDPSWVPTCDTCVAAGDPERRQVSRLIGRMLARGESFDHIKSAVARTKRARQGAGR